MYKWEHILVFFQIAFSILHERTDSRLILSIKSHFLFLFGEIVEVLYGLRISCRLNAMARFIYVIIKCQD